MAVVVALCLETVGYILHTHSHTHAHTSTNPREATPAKPAGRGDDELDVRWHMKPLALRV